MSPDAHDDDHDHEGPDSRPDPRTVALAREETLLLIVDVQEKAAAALDPRLLAPVLKNLETLIRAALRLEIPIVASEQDPMNDGPMVQSLSALLPRPPLPKLEFSVGNNKALARAVQREGRRQVIVAGLEAHVCVFQTARDLVRGGFAAFVPQDAVLSRTEDDRLLGLRLAERAGATVTGTEALLFDLLGAAGTDEHRDLLPLLRP
jgi:nicotinamidase-related amidase